MRVLGTTLSLQLVSEVKVLMGTVPSNFIVDLNSSQCVNLHICMCVCFKLHNWEFYSCFWDLFNLSYAWRPALRVLISRVKWKVKWLSRVQLVATPWTVAHQAPLPMGFSRQEFWRGLPFPSPGHLPNPGIKPGSPTLQVDSLPSVPPGKPRYFMGKVRLIAAPPSQQWLWKLLCCSSYHWTVENNSDVGKHYDPHLWMRRPRPEGLSTLQLKQF